MTARCAVADRAEPRSLVSAAQRLHATGKGQGEVLEAIYGVNLPREAYLFRERYIVDRQPLSFNWLANPWELMKSSGEGGRRGRMIQSRIASSPVPTLRPRISCHSLPLGTKRRRTENRYSATISTSCELGGPRLSDSNTSLICPNLEPSSRSSVRRCWKCFARASSTTVRSWKRGSRRVGTSTRTVSSPGSTLSSLASMRCAGTCPHRSSVRSASLRAAVPPAVAATVPRTSPGRRRRARSGDRSTRSACRARAPAPDRTRGCRRP
jgi:hypothetical protein